MKTAVVLTTINVPTVLDSYVKDMTESGVKDVMFVVIGDLKTPAGCKDYISGLKGQGVEAYYLGPDEQEKWISRYPELREILPYNSIQRRNIGYLFAAEAGAEKLITIDDDNYVIPGSRYFIEHDVTGNVMELPAIRSSSGWFNICSFLKTDTGRPFYHRGFPVTERWKEETLDISSQKKRIAVNVGLWLGDPDVDTITRLEGPLNVLEIKMDHPRISLQPGTRSPFNSQNTSFMREVLPCFFLVTLGEIDGTLTVDNFRYDDIWMSYFAGKVIDHMGDQIAFGVPAVRQDRNVHDYMKDMRDEMLPMQMTPKVIEMIDGIELKENTYLGSYMELKEKLSSALASYKKFTLIEGKCMDLVVKGMDTWSAVCSRALEKGKQV